MLLKKLLLSICVIIILSFFSVASGANVSDWTIDTTFVYGSWFQWAVTATKQWLSLYGLDKIIVWWTSTTAYKDTPINNIARINFNWDYDTSFLSQWFWVMTWENAYYRQVFWLLTLSNGKILVWWSFTTQDGVAMTGMIARMNADGTPDTTFINNAFRLTWSIWSYWPVVVMREQTNGQILVWWYFDKYDNIVSSKIMRMNADGTIDNTFNIWLWFGPAGNSTVVHDIAQQWNWKTLVWWVFTTYQWTWANRIIRLNEDGTRDISFGIGSGFDNSVLVFAIQSDWKILVWWSFTTYQWIWANRVIRLNEDWTRDTSFDIGSGFNSSVNSIVIESNGKILIWWSFTTYQWTWANRMIRLNEDWTKDMWFDIGSGFNSSVNSIIKDQNGWLFIWWWFTDYNWVSANKIIKLSYKPLSITWVVPTLISSGNIIDTIITITWVVPVSATWVLLDVSSTASWSILCSQITIYEVQCSLSVYTSWDITIIAKDINENITTNSFTGYLIDNISPVINMISPLPWTMLSSSWDIIVSFTWYDNLSGFVNYECQINNWLWVACINNITVNAYEQWTYIINVRWIDNAWNIWYWTTTFNIAFPVKSSWWGGWNSITKDNCPNGDYTSSYYDNACGEKPESGTWEVEVKEDTKEEIKKR